jgi:Ca2+-transporting ATPase
MGGATSICTDKTGTLTKNEMTVVAATVGTNLPINSHFDQQAFRQLLLSPTTNSSSPTTTDETPISIPEFRNLLFEGIALNTTAFESAGDSRKFVGSKTEIALLNWATSMGMADYQGARSNAAQRIVCVFPFSSERKTMSTVVRCLNLATTCTFYRIYIKGASEIILQASDKYLQISRGRLRFNSTPIDQAEQQKLKEIIGRYAGDSLRTVGLAYKDLEEGQFQQLTGPLTGPNLS